MGKLAKVIHPGEWTAINIARIMMRSTGGAGSSVLIAAKVLKSIANSTWFRAVRESALPISPFEKHINARLISSRKCFANLQDKVSRRTRSGRKTRRHKWNSLMYRGEPDGGEARDSTGVAFTRTVNKSCGGSSIHLASFAVSAKD